MINQRSVGHETDQRARNVPSGFPWLQEPTHESRTSATSATRRPLLLGPPPRAIETNTPSPTPLFLSIPDQSPPTTHRAVRPLDAHRSPGRTGRVLRDQRLVEGARRGLAIAVRTGCRADAVAHHFDTGHADPSECSTVFPSD